MNDSLRKLARLCGVSLCYRDMNAKLVYAKASTVTKLLEAILERDLSSIKEVKSILKEVELEKTNQILPPVLVAWDGKLKSVFATLREEESSSTISLSQNHKSTSVPKTKNERIITRHKDNFVRVCLRLNLVLPFGYHSFSVKVGKRTQSVMVISAPSQLATKNPASRRIGVFAPLYALRSHFSCGIGDLNDLKLLMDWVAKSSGAFVSTLPLLAIDYTKKPIDPSPYSAITRLFLNEIYLPVDSNYSTNSSEHVDYKTVYGVKKEALLKQSNDFFSKGFDKKKDYLSFLKFHPELQKYAQYRAKTKLEQQFHCYCQFKLHQKLSALKKTKLFLDLPVGVGRSSFDVKHFPAAFLKGVSAGAPPDAMFRSGQNWGFYPAHPLQARVHNYDYFRQVLKLHFSYAQMLRVDHMAGMHRIFAIPDAAKSSDGAYIRYRSDELYALLLLEAHYNCAHIVGEDLGVVPVAVQQKMKKHKISGMWVFEYMTWQAPKKAIEHISNSSLRLVSTHDTPPLFGFYQGIDIEILRERGFLSTKEEEKQLFQRRRQLQKWMRFLLKRHQKQFVDDAFLVALLKKLSSSKSSLLQINIEDLWLESDPQNVPGTSSEYPNWSKKHRYSLEEWTKSESISELIRSLAHAK